MTSDSRSRDSGFDLPGWADSRLVVRVAGYGDEPFVISGNPHTFRGLVSVFSLRDRVGQSARPRDIIVQSEYARGYLSGYLSGNEPAPPSTGLLEGARWARERDFFHAFERELPVERGGLFAVNAASAADPTADPFDLLGSMFEALESTSGFWASARWVPVSADHVPAMPLRMSEDVWTMDAWLTPPMALDAWVPQHEIRVVNADTTGVAGAAVELVIHIATGDDQSLDRLAVTINIERPEVLHGAVSGQGSPDETALRAVFNAVVDGLRPDVASVSGGAALRACNGFGLDPAGDGELIKGIPGWLTYLGPRVLHHIHIDDATLDPEKFSATRSGAGLLIGYVEGLSALGVDDANQIAAALAV